jgi:hypothetical protein
MARRNKYDRVIKGERGLGAFNKLVDYWKTGQKTDETDNIGKGKDKVQSKKLLIRPFAFGADDTEANNPYPVGFFIVSSAGQPTVDKYKNLTIAGSVKISDCAIETKPISYVEVPSTGVITAAKVIVVTGRSAKATSKTSKVTGLKYGSYGGTSTSLPFGVAVTGSTRNTIEKLNTNTQTEAIVYGLIKTAIENSVTTGTKPTISWKREYVEAPKI